MSGAAGGVADGDFQEVFRVPGLPVLLDDRVERGLEQLVDQRRGRVVRAGGLALVAAQVLQPEAGFGSINLGFEFEQRLVDASQFFRAEVLVVDAVDASFLVPEGGEEADGRQEALVGEFAAAQEVGGETFSTQRVSGAEEQAAEGGEGELGVAAVGAEGVEDDDERPPQVLMAITPAAGRDAAEACDGEIVRVAVAGGLEFGPLLGGRVRRVLDEQGVTAFGDEQEDELVGEAEQLVAEVLAGQAVVRQVVPQIR